MLKSTVYIQWVTTLSLTIRLLLAVVASQIGEIPRNSLKIQTYTVQRHPRSSILVLIKCAYATSYQSLIVTLDVSPTVYEILTHLASKQLVLPPHPYLTLPSEGTPCNINIIYTSLKSTFSGLQFCRRHHETIFIRLAIVAPKIAKSDEIPTKFDLIAVQGHPMSSILDFLSIESSYATSYQSHRLRGSANPVLTATHHSYRSAKLSDFFSGSPLEVRPPNRF